jgi:molybdopterin-guanine dinucleotide biosynthesis protein A
MDGAVLVAGDEVTVAGAGVEVVVPHELTIKALRRKTNSKRFIFFMGSFSTNWQKYYNPAMLSVVIQAGGQSSRMGEDKALKPFLGRPLIQRVVDRFRPIADEIIVTTNRPEDYDFLNLRLFSDIKPDRGALGGLYTAIASAAHPYVAVIACDMPFASAKLIEAMSRLIVQKETDVVIPKSDDYYEPLHAVYRRETCLPAIEAAIGADQWKVIAWFPEVKVYALVSEEVKLLDPDGLAFWNVNTLEEFAEAERIATAQSAPGRGHG